MGLTLTKQQFYTFEEYLELEKVREFKSEFYQGELFAMAGGTLNHNRIITNILLAFRPIAKRKGCDVFNSDVILELIQNEYYVYPDILLTCHPLDLKANSIIKYPSIVVEVLSKSTENYDRGMKMRYYVKLPSLTHYFLIDQHQPLVEMFEKNTQGEWIYKTYEKIEESIFISFLEIELPLVEVYEGVSFSNESDEEV